MVRTNEDIINVQNLTCAYGDSVIIDDISFDVRQGEIFIILGGSGCGKSTVLKHMIGLYPPVAGAILIEGDDIGSAYGQQRLQILQRIGVMYQMGGFVRLHDPSGKRTLAAGRIYFHAA